MTAYDITLIPGDGVGPEVIDSAARCVEASGVAINWDVQMAGDEAIKKYKTPLPRYTIDSIKKNKIALKGPVTTPVGTGFRSVNVALRQSLDLFANIRPAKIYPGIKTSYKKVDVVVIRENTEDLYSGIEFANRSKELRQLIALIYKTKNVKLRVDTSISIKAISHHASKRIAKFAFDYAKSHKRKKVTAVHKANIMKFSDGLFLSSARYVAKRYPKIEFEDRIIDNFCMQLVQEPSQFDVVLAPNLYGDIISDLCAGLVGGLGISPSANIGNKYAIFEPVHGSAPKYAGKDKVNPTAAILSAAVMLKYLGEDDAADAVEKAVKKVISGGKYVTYDISKKPVGTKRMTEEIIKYVRKCR